MTLQEITNIESKDIFKLLMVGYSGITIPLSIVSGILAFFDIVPANLNNHGYVGVKGLVVAILTAPIYILLMAVATWLFLIIGLRLARLGMKAFKGQ
jgi:hypothetical protein